MKFSDYLKSEGFINEAPNKKYFLLYKYRENASGAEFHNYYVWTIDDLKTYNSRAKGSTMDKCVETLNKDYMRKSNMTVYFEIVGKVNGIEEPVDISSEGIFKTKEKAILALKKLCPKAAQVLNRAESGETEEETNESASKDNAKILNTALKSKYKGPYKFDKVLRAFAPYDDDYEDDPEYCTVDFVINLKNPADRDVSDMWDELDDIRKAVEKAVKGLKVTSYEGTSYTITSIEEDDDATTRGDPQTACGFKAHLKK